MAISYSINNKSGSYPLVVIISNVTASGDNILWDFGDNTTSTDLTPKPHEYLYPGTYYITGSEYEGDSLLSELTYEIKVFDNTLATLGIGTNSDERTDVSYGNNNEQGYGWSDQGDDGNIWVDTKASIIPLFNNNGDSLEVKYDSRTGLPFVCNPRKTYGGSGIVDAWKDKIDPLVADSGIPIRTRAKLPEFLASHESYSQSMSDISMFFSPIYKENQGETGYNEDGMLSDMTIDLELYKDDLIDEKATALDIPMKRELYFDRTITGQILQLAFETSEAEYRFTKAECFLVNYDKVRSPFKGNMSEKDYQNILADVDSTWITRGSLVNRVNKQTIEGLTVSETTGPDSYLGSSFTCSEDTEVGNSATAALVVVCDQASSSNVFASVQEVISQEVISIGQIGDWYGYYTNSVNANFSLKSGVRYFDLRLLSQITTSDVRSYYINDIYENKGNSVCPRFL